MLPGLVYLRPQPVAFIRVEGPIDQVAQAAWDRLLKWSDNRLSSDNVRFGYGMVLSNGALDGSEEVVYEAALDVPFADSRGETRALGIKQLPGGAYLRKPHDGYAPTSLTALGDFSRTAGDQSHLRLDRNRPLIEIFRGNPCKKEISDLKIDLLLPVIAGRSAKAA